MVTLLSIPGWESHLSNLAFISTYKFIPMKTLLSVFALSVAMAGLASAEATNKECPVSGKPVKEGVTSKHEGKDVGFCCNNCKGKFDKEPAKYLGKLK